VRQPEPEVTVEQAEPEVAVEQAQPEVSVEQAEPKVEVSQAEPEVTLRQGGQQPESAAQQSERERLAEQQQRAGERRAGQQRPDLEGQREQQGADAVGGALAPEQLVGESVHSSEGEEIGEISGVAQSRQDSQMHALVDVGGFLGIGQRTVALPVARLEVDHEGKLMTSMTREELESLPEYDSQQYAEIEDEGRYLR